MNSPQENVQPTKTPKSLLSTQPLQKGKNVKERPIFVRILKKIILGRKFI